MEICIAVADWARGLMTWVLVVPGGEGTDARRRKLPKHVRADRADRRTPSGSTDASTGSGRRAGMVVGWG
ncbi:hypothetical protein Stsp02_66500 [Streptomyces sp. NBRC 14336]|nr:hypothetical protein Stsp02_66500 [Streptomyces sp. NBRC 14336]